MISLYFENLQSELQSGMEEFGEEYGFEIVSNKSDADITIIFEYTKQNILEVCRKNDCAAIKYCNKAHIFRAVGEIIQYADDAEYSSSNEVYFDDICAMFDYSQGNQATKPVYLKKVLLRFASMGISSVMMYLEDGYEIEGEPYFGYMRPRYTYDEIKMLDDYAYSLGMEIVPCIQTLGHLSNPLRWGVYSDIRDEKSTLLVGSDKTYELIRKMLIAASAPVRTKRIHIGMDEAWKLGLGEYIKKNGYRKGSAIFREHLEKVIGITKELGLEPMIWVDMFFRITLEEMGCPSETFKTDKELDFESRYEKNNDGPALVFWDYHDCENVTRNMLKQCKKISDNIIVAGAIRNNRGFACKQGINIKNANTVLPISKEVGIRKVIATVWGDNCPEGNNYSALLGLQLFAEHGFSETVDKDKWYERFAFCGKCDPLAFESLKLFDEPCGVTEPDTIANYNFSKYLLWQDPMMGLFDANVSELEMKEHYSNLAKKMKCFAGENAEYKQFFEFYTAAAEALAAKSELGIRLHKAYLSGIGLDDAKDEVLQAKDAVKRLHEIHRDFWFTVNNPKGWEILDMRYGALLSRLETTAKRINDYVSGNIKNIPELEEKQLYYNGDKNMPQELEYPRIVSASHMEIVK